VTQWFVKAAGDLRAADALLEAGMSAHAVFHAQQAAEKAIKGLLVHHGVLFGKTHDLSALSRQCVDAEPDLADALDGVEKLTVYAWRFRYPGSLDEPLEAEARSDVATARRVFDAVVQQVPGAHT
jgi:HEPN domain-containing protein